MKVAVFSTQTHDQCTFEAVNESVKHELSFFKEHLHLNTAPLAAGFSAICCFVNDELTAPVLEVLATGGTKLIALRTAGYNHVDLIAAKRLGLTVVRVPAYSPYAVAEHAVGLILSLNRHIHRAYCRVREANFSLHGLLGFDLHGCTVGVIGMGKIGQAFARIMMGFGCHVLAYDPQVNVPLENVSYVTLDELYQQSKIISLHCPLTKATLHLINKKNLAKMPKGVMLINTSRGAVIETQAAIDALKTGQLGYLGLDVYEEEEHLFFEDLSETIISDDCFARLQTFPNVLITGHQGFFTREALHNIAETTLNNIRQYAQGTLDAANTVVGS